MKKCMNHLLFSIVALLLVFGCAPAATPAPAGLTTPMTPKPILTPAPVKPVPRAATPKPVVTPQQTKPAPKPVVPAGEPYFKGKTIEIVVGSAPGGGTDATARVVAAYLPKFIPGNPKAIVRNQTWWGWHGGC